MNAALLEPALLLQWFGALCSTAAGAAILNRNRLPHAPQIGRFLLALAADLGIELPVADTTRASFSAVVRHPERPAG